MVVIGSIPSCGKFDSVVLFLGPLSPGETKRGQVVFWAEEPCRAGDIVLEPSAPSVRTVLLDEGCEPRRQFKIRVEVEAKGTSPILEEYVRLHVSGAGGAPTRVEVFGWVND